MKKLLMTGILLATASLANANTIIYCPQLISCANTNCNTYDPNFRYKDNGEPVSGVYLLKWVAQQGSFIACQYKTNVLGQNQRIQIISVIPMKGLWNGAQTGASCPAMAQKCPMQYGAHI